VQVFLDHSAPAPLCEHLPGHEVTEAYRLGWARLQNGELIAAAESAGFQVLITADKNMQYQQNLAGRAIAIVILEQAQWPALRPHVSLVLDAVDSAKPGEFVRVTLPGR
jgi:hypothetical protein